MGITDFLKTIKQEVKVIKGEETKDKLYKSKHNYRSEQAAVTAFKRSRAKLFHVNKWSDLPGISSGFNVYDAFGNPKETGIPEIGNYIYIDLPGPTPETWVKVIDLKDRDTVAEFTVSPSHDPREEGEKAKEVEHFFADEATSTFRVERIGATLYAYEIGKEEGINNKGKEAGGRQLINTLIAVGGWIAVQETQWRKLTDYLVNKIEIDDEQANSLYGSKIYNKFQQSRLAKTVVTGLAGTTAMTAFSYGLSKLAHEQFREPELLSYLVHEQPLVRITRNYSWANKGTGYVLHYLAGAGYAAGYEYLWKPSVKLPTLLRGAAYGLVAGLSGALVWEATIQQRKKPPRLEKAKYYPHLVLAHVVFGITGAFVSKAMSK